MSLGMLRKEGKDDILWANNVCHVIPVPGTIGTHYFLSY